MNYLDAAKRALEQSQREKHPYEGYEDNEVSSKGSNPLSTEEAECRICGQDGAPHRRALDRPRYARAPRDQWCEDCRKLEARGVRVLLCGTCDVPVTVRVPVSDEPLDVEESPQ